MRRLIPPFIVAIFLVFTAVPASATHSWRNYHWARTTQSFTLELGDNTTTAAWQDALGVAATDWSASTVLDAVVAAGLTTDPSACRPTLGRVEVCNGKYGEKPWIGIASIWVYPGGHIAQGTVRNNDTYLDSPKYPQLSGQEWKQFVMCQEIGHTFGLEHQDEDLSNANLGTCMDYTRDPSGSLFGQASNEHPNRHDYEQLKTIYQHRDETTTVGVSGTALGGSFTPSEGQRGTSRFVTELPNGGRLVTLVIWVP